ncbi:MAG: dihydropyrimidinase [Candidatus Methanomethylicaceae archaeon]|jgi:dihydropyrimidinase
MDLLIKGGTLITPTDSIKADIGVDDGKIVAIGTDIPGKADDVIDAKGKYVFPGAIDSHTHMDMPFMGTVTADDFESGTTCAAYGGVTTLLDFAMQPKDKDFLETLKIWHGKADPKAFIDFGFHVAVTNLTDDLVKQIPEVLKAGVSSFKLFMTYSKGGLFSDDARIYRMLEESKKHGFLVQVHAENDTVLEMLKERYIKAGNTSAEFHAKSRPNFVEAEATHRALALAAATGGNLYVVHMTCMESLAELANTKGFANVYGETCPHYLTLTDEKYLSPKGRRYIMSPPLRSKDDNDALWMGLYDEILSTVATDHCAFNDAQKDVGKDDFTKVPNGAPGTETMVPVLFSEGVRKNRITLNQMVKFTSYNPAKIFGMYPAKGCLNIGSDADIVIFDPKCEMELTAKNLHSKSNYTVFEGMVAKGMPTHTFVRGTPVLYDRKLVGKKGAGKFVSRGKHIPL